MGRVVDLHSDWRWRINNLYKIIDKQGRLSTLKENGIQFRINNCRKKKKMILKYRQGGVTTGEVIKQLDYVCFSDSKNAFILAHRKDTIEEIFSKVRLAYKYMPDGIRPAVDKGGGSKYEMRFPSRESKISCALEQRGGTNHWLHISEAAFADPQRVKATLETVPPDGIITFESTPNGMGNDFYRKWIDKDHSLEKLFFPWFIHQEYQLDPSPIKHLTIEETEFCQKVKRAWGITITPSQIAFRRSKQRDLGDMFLQEYPEDDVTCFLMSGNSPMDLIKIKKLMDEVREPIIDEKTFKQWLPFNSSHTYCMGCDTAEGVKSDYSVASIWDMTDMEQAAEMRSNLWKPRDFAEKINELATMYHKKGTHKWPLVAVERNNHGHAVLQKLEDFNYPNLYKYKKDTVGWQTDKITRPLMLDAFIEGVENETVLINSLETLGECLTLVDNDGKVEASDGEHDDGVIANSIAIQMILKIGSNDLYDNLENRILL